MSPNATHDSVSRRHFLTAIAGGASTMLGARALLAQSAGSTGIQGATMEGDGYRPVRRLAKPGAAPSMSQADRDALEHHLKCPCPCTLDVFTCRTSMPCGFSPRLHADVVALVDGGYSGDEIIAAFVGAYGEQALMAPTRQGFNQVGWAMPFVALGTGIVVVAALIRRWGRRATGPSAPIPLDVAATPDEIARIDAAVREDRP